MTPLPFSIAKGRWASTCFLLEPLGWVRERLGELIQVEPRLLEALVKIDRARMHLLALGLAYARKDITPALAFLLLERSRHEILETIFGYRPAGTRSDLAAFAGQSPVSPHLSQAHRSSQ